MRWPRASNLDLDVEVDVKVKVVGNWARLRDVVWIGRERNRQLIRRNTGNGLRTNEGFHRGDKEYVRIRFLVSNRRLAVFVNRKTPFAGEDATGSSAIVSSSPNLEMNSKREVRDVVRAVCPTPFANVVGWIEPAMGLLIRLNPTGFVAGAQPRW
jgi:hypothetical protein